MIESPRTTVADVIAHTLSRYGARFAFGIPGNDVLESVRACEEAGIEFVLAKAEPSAAFMADAVYQLTGAPAVLLRLDADLARRMIREFGGQANLSRQEKTLYPYFLPLEEEEEIIKRLMQS